MKSLIIVRHAKSSWDNPMLKDVDRPLNNRGVRNAYEMGQRHSERLKNIDIALSSLANRAFHTAIILLKSAGVDLEKIKVERAIYEGYSSGMAGIAANISDEHQTAMMFGHNPGITAFVNQHQKDQYIDNVVTCAITKIDFDIDSWKSFNHNTVGKLDFYDFPKSAKEA